MATTHIDSLQSNSFTPKEAPVELLDVIAKRSVIVCLINSSGKNFISCKAIEHSLTYAENRNVLYVAKSQSSSYRQTSYFKRLICCSVHQVDSRGILNNLCKVNVTTIDWILPYLKDRKFPISEIGLIILQESHIITKDGKIREFLSYFCHDSARPRILGLAGSLLNSVSSPNDVEIEISDVESAIGCPVNTASDIVTILRHGTKPIEYIIEYSDLVLNDDSLASFVSELEEEANNAISYLDDHVYDPEDMYGEFIDEELPDPKEEPINILHQFLHVLKLLGLYAADKAAYVLLIQVENMRLKIKYERHFLLLCVVSTVLVKIRAMIDDFLSQYPEHYRIYNFCSKKILRLIEIVGLFKPCVANEAKQPACRCAEITKYLSERLDDDSLTLPPRKYSKEKIETDRRQTRRPREWCKNWRNLRTEDDKPQKTFEVDPNALCGLVLVDDDLIAKVLFYIFNDLRTTDDRFSFLYVQFCIALSASGCDPRTIEKVYRRQELVLRSFRMRECNLLIGTSYLESGIDLPKCNLVIRFEQPRDYRSYVLGKARTRGHESLHCIFVAARDRHIGTKEVARYQVVDKMLLNKCATGEPKYEEETEADLYNNLVKPFCPLRMNTEPHVDLSSSISLVNRYCSKLPSDTFTRLAPIWSIQRIESFERVLFICTLRLPTNSPLKKEITGPAMPTVVLARRFTALQCCLALHATREIDDNLLPVTKETFWHREEERLGDVHDNMEESPLIFDIDARPGTTKRRQYYNKRIASCLTDCRPKPLQDCFLYEISMTLTCPLPEEQNTRGRQIRAPEDSPRGFGILTAKTIPPVGAFPIFTRAGELSVRLQLSPRTVKLTETDIDRIVPFINFTFTSVLRLQKYLMMFDPDTSENSYFIVPTSKDSDGNVDVDWDFLNLIYKAQNHVLDFIPESDRVNYKFRRNEYKDSVVCPWYRNQDQPQYFYVAEICDYLSPQSAFPGVEYATFEEYYLHKYGIQIQNIGQALLDVDHTSARLNFLTPRYVNRKGVALPTTSEEKKRLKRENLSQKQILVPELCYIHPFPASLWQKAVCLPCILHRLNALILADEIRRRVARDMALGDPDDPKEDWMPLNFGWSLADVLQKKPDPPDPPSDIAVVEPQVNGITEKIEREKETIIQSDSSADDWLEVGTWSNDLAPPCNGIGSHDPSDIEMTREEDGSSWNSNQIRYGSPTNWSGSYASSYTSDKSYPGSESDSDLDSDEDSTDSEEHGFRIEFKERDVAEAVETNPPKIPFEEDEDEIDEWICTSKPEHPLYEETNDRYQSNLQKFQENIENSNLCAAGTPFSLPWSTAKANSKLVAGNTEYPFGSVKNIAADFNVPSSEENDLPHAALIRQCNHKFEVQCDIVRKFSEKNDDEVRPAGNRQIDEETGNPQEFSFDAQPKLEGHPGPSPNLILQALTMSNANDGINLERLETIGDSFLKYAITNYLYCTYENVHEGKLSHLRSKQVSNLNLYRLGRRKVFAESMVATKFEPHDNWLPPCYFVPRELERALIEAGLPASHWNQADLPALHNLNRDEITRLVHERREQLGFCSNDEISTPQFCLSASNPCFIPYNLMTQHSIPDKSVADCVEALIGAYLVACGPRGALLFMSWLGIKVLHKQEVRSSNKKILCDERKVGFTLPAEKEEDGSRTWLQTRYLELAPPRPPLLRHVTDPEGELERLLTGFDALEDGLHYHFRDRSYLLQALTHASYSHNQLTDCYQRLEFLGDAVLDYLITRHLYEDPRHHSPGALTDLRSALVNNTIFATLAVRHDFHKYFRHLCPTLHEVLDRFVRIQQENNHAISDECYLIDDEVCEEAEDVEVPKALGDVFESLAGAIFLDSGMSLDAVWRVYYRMMKSEIDAFSTNVPKSPIRELLELEPETAQFGKPEKLADGRRVRVSVEVFGKGTFKGIGRNYRIAKCTAAKCALKQLKRRGLVNSRK